MNKLQHIGEPSIANLFRVEPVSVLRENKVDDGFFVKDMVPVSNGSSQGVDYRNNKLTGVNVFPVVDSKETVVRSFSVFPNSNSTHRIAAELDGSTLGKNFSLADDASAYLKRVPRSLFERLYVALRYTKTPTRTTGDGGDIESSAQDSSKIRVGYKVYAETDSGQVLMNSARFYENAGGTTSSDVKDANYLDSSNYSDYNAFGIWVDLANSKSELETIFSETDQSVWKVGIYVAMSQTNGTNYKIIESDGTEKNEYEFKLAELDLSYAGQKQLYHLNDLPLGSQRIGNILSYVDPSGDVRFVHDVFLGDENDPGSHENATSELDNPDADTYIEKIKGDAVPVAAKVELDHTNAKLIYDFGATTSGSTYTSGGTSYKAGTDNIPITLHNFYFTGKPNS